MLPTYRASIRLASFLICLRLASAQGSAAATLAPANLTFSGQAVGSASSSQSVTLTNGGGAPLTIASIALTGAASGDFTQTNTCGSSVAAGANCSISVVFKPTKSGSRTATVTITDSAAGSPHTVPLTGTADSGASAQGPATATLAPASLTFSGQAVGSASSSRSVTLTNGGGAPLTVASIALTGAASGDFTQTNTCGSSVAAGANCSISVVFKPTASGSRTATVTITDGAAGSPHSVPLTGTTDSGTSACKSTVNGAISYTDLKSSKVSLPYGTPFVITGGIADVQLAGGALSTLIAPQTVAGDYNASDGVQGAVTASSITGTSWNFNVGKLSPDTSVVINFQFTGPLSPAVVQTVLNEVLADPAYTAASTQFVQSALGRPAAEQIAATTLLSQSAAAVVTTVLKRMGLTPKNPDDLKAALGTTLANTIPPIFNLNGETSSVLNPAFHVAEGVNLSADALKALPTADLVEKLKTIDYSKTSAKAPADQDTQTQVKGIVDQFLATYQNAVGGLGNGLQAVLFTGSSSLAVGSDQATDVVCDLQKYAGFDVGALYSFRLNELRSFAMVHVYFGPVQLKTGGAPPKSGRGEGLRQRASLAFGMALKDLSGSTQSKISGENAFIYGVGIRLNKYFRLTAGGLLYRTTLPAANGSTSPANGSLRHEFFIGPSIDVTALPALQSIFAKAKSN